MSNTFLEHPPEDALERYLMHQSDEQEVELVETHTFACESCVSRLEALELQLAAMKLALQDFHQEEVAKSVANREKASWHSWFTLPRLSMAGVAAALVLGVGLTVPTLHHAGSEEQVNLTAYRGLEAPLVAKGHKLDVNLNASGLNTKEVTVELVDETGSELWRGNSAIHDQQVTVQVPALTATGSYLFRLYAPANQGEANGDLLREFAFKVQ